MNRNKGEKKMENGTNDKSQKMESYGNETADNEELDYLFNQYYHNNMKKNARSR